MVGERSLSDFAGECLQHLVGPGATLDELLELAAGRPCDVDEGPKRTRREQRLAGAPQDPGRRALLLAEPAHNRGLPHPRLAPHEHQPPLPGLEHRRQQIAQDRQVVGSLEQLERLSRPG